jgi:hypothetical protein
MSAHQDMKSIERPQELRLGTSPDRLNSWKEIALYLKRQVRTVQHWEKREGLPVHRHFHNKQGTIFAFRSEIEAWGKRRAAERIRGEETCASETHPVRIAIMAFASNLTDSPLAGLLNETARLLETAQVQLLSEEQAQTEDFVLRWNVTGQADFCTAELFSKKLQTVIWSRSFGADASPSALVRSVALLVRSTAVGSLWNDLMQSAAMDSRELSPLVVG